MQSLSACLTSETLVQLGHDELTPAELRAVEEHLSECELCRNRLGDAETDELWREQIAPALQSPGESPRSALSLELEPISESSLDSVLKLLGPTDDPQMLGRIGTYEIVGVIGRGGMGVVFKAFDGALNRFVAIKMLLPHLAASGAARKRFAREGKAAAAVIDEHVLPIYAVAEWQSVPYLVTQYSRGTTLQARIAEQGPLELKEILRIGMQTARGLAAAHAQGLVHRDVKPSNILLDGTVERAMLTDFGLARAADDASITRTGVIAGTPQYMSPEQARAGTVDGRSDLFGLGCVMYAMGAGRPPFRADNSFAILRLITDHEPKSIREINSDIPDWLCGIIAKLMAKEAGDRYATAAEVAELLESCLAHLQQPATVPLPIKAQAAAPARPRIQGKAGRWSPRSLAIACAAAAFAIFAGVIVVLELNKGTLTIESRVEGVKIKITQGEKVVDQLTLEKNAQSIRIAAGKYNIEIEGDADVATVENGQITLARGGTEVVRIVQKPAASPAAESLAERWGRTHDSLRFGQQLSQAVEKFNQENEAIVRGKRLPPLTEDEVIASLKWAEDGIESEFSPEEFKYVRDISEMRVLPEPFKIESLPELRGAGNDRFQVWFIQLTLTRPNGTEFRHNIREQYLRELDENGKVPPHDTFTLSVPDNWRPLAAAIKTFNDSHSRLGGVVMPPVTEHEVIAAIRFWKTQRAKFDVTDAEFKQLQDVANLRALPPGAELSIITHFEPGDGNEYLIWSLRLHLKKLEAGARFPMFGDVFRTHYVKVRSLDEGKIAWGPVAKNGLQAGVLFESPKGVVGGESPTGAGRLGGGGMAASDLTNKTVALGAPIRPRFYFRNTADKHKEASFPNLMTHSYYKKLEATLANGQELAIETNPDPTGPVGWLQMPFAFGAQHEIRGLPILLGAGDRGDAETAIRVSKGNKIRLRFTLDNYLDKDADPLQTDWVDLTIE